MASVILVHSEETLTVSALQLIKNYSLFENNPALLVSPYQVKSSDFRGVYLQIGKENSHNHIHNLTGLSRLREEFGCSQFAVKLSKSSPPSKGSQGRQLGSPPSGVHNTFLSESFQFVANGIMIESSVPEKSALFPAVREQISLDGCAPKFTLDDSET
jgi:hypothetical protein